MKPEDTANLIAIMSAGISLISAGVAIWATRSSRKTAREQMALQARLTAIEEERRSEEVEARQRAQVTLSISEVVKGTARLVLTNGGPAVARSVTLAISSTGEAKPPLVSRLDQLPVDLRLGQSMSFNMAVALGDATLIDALVCWVDDAGPHEETHPLRIR